MDTQGSCYPGMDLPPVLTCRRPRPCIPDPGLQLLHLGGLLHIGVAVNVRFGPPPVKPRRDPDRSGKVNRFERITSLARNVQLRARIPSHEAVPHCCSLFRRGDCP